MKVVKCSHRHDDHCCECEMCQVPKLRVCIFLHFFKPLNHIMEFCKSGLEGNNMMLKLLLIFGLGILYFAFVLCLLFL